MDMAKVVILGAGHVGSMLHSILQDWEYAVKSID